MDTASLLSFQDVAIGGLALDFVTVDSQKSATHVQIYFKMFQNVCFLMKKLPQRDAFIVLDKH